MTTDLLAKNNSQISVPFDTDKAAAFAGGLVAPLNAGGLSLMMSIGHRTGLFDVMADLPPVTSQQLADAANLRERYVREWLNALTVGRIIEYQLNDCTYSLPAEHAAVLTRAAKADNIAVFFQHVSGLGVIEDEIIHCFINGGDVPYTKFPRFHEVMAEDSGQTIVDALEELILPAVPGLVERLTAGINVLDVGCGRRSPDCRLAGP